VADCGCGVPRLETPFGDDIDYCPLHAAAPDLLAVLALILDTAESPEAFPTSMTVPFHALETARAVVFKATDSEDVAP
jgi:hypothetical protein